MSSSYDRVVNIQGVGVNSAYFTPERRTIIYAALRKGLTLRLAAKKAGVHPDTVRYWRDRGAQQIQEAENRGEKPIGEYAAFYTKCDECEAEFIENAMDTLSEFAAGGQELEVTEETKPDGTRVVKRKLQPPNWTGKAWQIERKEKDYSNRQIVEHQGKQVVEVKIVETGRWKEINASMGKVIEGEFIDVDSEPALDAPRSIGPGSSDEALPVCVRDLRETVSENDLRDEPGSEERA